LTTDVLARQWSGLAFGSPDSGAFSSWSEKLAMNNEQQLSAAVRKANLQFRKEKVAKESSAAWVAYGAEAAATRLKTARLREQRLARDATTAITAPTKPAKPAKVARRRSASK
jgi:hypothetical protein